MKPKIQLQKRKRCHQNGSVGKELAPRVDNLSSIPRSHVVEERMDSDFHTFCGRCSCMHVCAHNRKRTAFELGMLVCTWVIEVVG